jgi:hypothetical protein
MMTIRVYPSSGIWIVHIELHDSVVPIQMLSRDEAVSYARGVEYGWNLSRKIAPAKLILEEV